MKKPCEACGKMKKIHADGKCNSCYKLEKYFIEITLQKHLEITRKNMERQWQRVRKRQRGLETLEHF